MAKSTQRAMLMTPEAMKLIAARFKVLGEPLRLRIIQELEKGELNVSDIAEVVGATQPNVSKHLKMLQEAGLLFRRQNGNTVYYSVADKSIFDICGAVCASLRKRYYAQADSLINQRGHREKKN